MKAKVFIMVMAFHILVVAGLYLLSACSTRDGPVSAIGPPALEATPKTPRLNFRAPSRPANPEEFAIIEDAPADAPSPELDPVFNAGSDLEDFTADPAPGPAMVYVVESGDTLWQISSRHGVSLDELLMANGLTRNSTLQIGQRLTIPVEAPPEIVSETSDVEKIEPLAVEPIGPEPVEALPVTTQPYTVVAGDTLSSISRRFNTRVEDIMSASGLSSHNLQIDQVLSIPVNSISNAGSPVVLEPAPVVVEPVTVVVQPVPVISPSPVPSASPAAEQETIIHIVQPGETPSGIARKYGISVAQLMDDNRISDPRRIYAGGELKIRLSEAQQLEPLPTVVEPAPSLSLDAPVTPTEFDESVFDDLEGIPEVEVAPQ